MCMCKHFDFMGSLQYNKKNVVSYLLSGKIFENCRLYVLLLY